MALKDADARRAYHREWSRKNREKINALHRSPEYKATRLVWQRANKAHTKAKLAVHREWFRSLKDRPCQDCGGRFPACAMDFDHRDPSTKAFSLSAGVGHRPRAVILAEIEKCDLVCANCHRVRTDKAGYCGVRRKAKPAA